MDNSQMKMLLMAYKTESVQMKMRIDILTAERNVLMEKLNGVRLVGSERGVPTGFDKAGVVPPRPPPQPQQPQQQRPPQPPPKG